MKGAADHAGEVFDARRLVRPDASLLNYYIVMSVLSTIAFPFVFLPLYFKYHTLRYRFDDEGVSMAWGILFRREVYLTYRRIQDIHVSRNIIQRWMGLATVAIQTASGSSRPEMSIEGILQADALRDFLYQKMRGAKGLDDGPHAVAGESPDDQALILLREIRDALAAANLKAHAGARP
jgi:uncharacterized protein